MKINEKLLNKDIITAYLNADYTFSSGGAYLTVPFNRYYSVGNRLQLDNNNIVIGAGIKAIKISAKIDLLGSSITIGGKNMVINKNGGIVDRVWNYISSKSNCFMSSPSRVIPVSEGDRISLGYYGSANETVNGTERFSFLTVEAIEYSN